jgi:hypothetical protein
MEISRKESNLIMIENRGYRFQTKQASDDLAQLLNRISRQLNVLENEVAELNKEIRTYLIEYAA